MFYNNITKLDLHGENRESARILVNDFINDCYKLKIKDAIIIHGKGSGIIKKTVHDELSKNKKIKSYKIDFFNDGQTIIELKNN